MSPCGGIRWTSGHNCFQKPSASKRFPAEREEQQQSFHSTHSLITGNPSAVPHTTPSPPSWASADRSASRDRLPPPPRPRKATRENRGARLAGLGVSPPHSLQAKRAGGEGGAGAAFPAPLLPSRRLRAASPPHTHAPRCGEASRASCRPALTSSTARRGRCSIPRSSLSLTAEERPWKQRRMLSITEAVSKEAMLGGAHSSSVEPSLLCSHRPVSLSRIDAILGAGRKKRGFSTGIL